MDTQIEVGVSREAVLWCYRLFLGRAPASQQIADSHLSRPSIENLRAFFATHPEFQNYLKALSESPKPAPVASTTTGRLDYIIDRIESAEFSEEPFKHLYIEDLLSAEDFDELVQSKEIFVPPAASDEALIAELERRSYKAIPFPGTTTDVAAYLDWHKKPSASKILNQETCEGYGVVLRLQKVRPGSILDEVKALFESDRFWAVAAAKFGLKGANLRRDWGVQKYLDGYEISPHPDIRSKALTFMVNVNPAEDSENNHYHTHYLKFRPERAYVQDFWTRETNFDRAWVPWDWCTTAKIQTRNNTMVMFAPDNDTLHSVKASYNHLLTQRTQFYGNLWYSDMPTKVGSDYKQLAALAPA
jgi:hypothetical protein